VHVSTKLNRSHALCGEESLILPCLGRTERDDQLGGPQAVTVEDSMGIVHLSHGRLEPASEQLLSEVAIVTRLAEYLFPGDSLDWAGMRADYDLVREHISRVVPGFEDFNRRVREPGGFPLPHPPRDSTVTRTYDRAPFARAWLGGSAGMAYVLRDKAHPLPARPAGVRAW
jgi:anaerobic selenocysteine-containing dehydrogenase